ncbi:MAG: acyl-CoA dehydrogenase family protein [Deltaproteobacteria bacterium]|nr:acyl-CoA dehydrogenase family protein [Deltaproteobacteria bacterium]MBI2210383.1 acyl-CoA dehydrogenase family protein [Deltaproteobacteria bacterium]MBI2347970.1 acyl-CoA dehydrogenase family protein [Deltaproteobacteria bacterium]MBI2990891.1 acyl-CoA dehydrogenase family protein [Deltaproteobacteria bacterium]
MDIFFDQEHLALRAKVRSWVEKNLISAGEKEADIEEQARQLVHLLGREGFTAYVAAKKYGGVRESVQARDLCIFREELARGSALADTMFAMQALGSYPITLAGSEEQKKRYLPAIAKGEAIAAFALTEPEAGSDISAMQTRAVRDGDGYRLTGVKRFISNAGIARTYTLFASTDPEKKIKGISAFVVEADTPGFFLKEKTSLLSPHPIGVIAFEDCRIPRTRLLGQEGEGVKIALATLDTLRCTVAAAAVGLAQRALEEAIKYSRGRRQFGQALAEFQATQFKIADMATELEAARLLVYQAAWASDHRQKDLKQKASMAKLFATEAAQRIVDQALQIHGGMGVVTGTPVERLYRDVRALRIYEGTSEIQRLVIAKGLLKEAKEEKQ